MTALTLMAEAASLADGIPSDLPASYRLRPMDTADVPALGALYLAAYDPGLACDTLEDAVADIRATFAGEYGDLWLDASPVVTWNDRIVAAVMTVQRGPWDDVPPCPFIVELFCDRHHRRRGLARVLLATTLRTVAEQEEEAVALRVDAGNVAARALYGAFGFEPWTPDLAAARFPDVG